MLRTAAGVGLRELAKKIDVSPAYLSQVESGKLAPPTPERIAKIAEMISIPVSPLLEMSERLNPRLTALLQSNPELRQLILAMDKIGLDSRDYLRLTETIRKLGRTGFLRLLNHGREHLRDFANLSHSSASVSLNEKPDFPNRILKSIDSRLIFPSLRAAKKNEALRFLAASAGKIHPELQVKKISHALMGREQESSSGLGHGVALPHLFVEGLSRTIIAVAKSQRGIEFCSIDGQPVYLICMILDGPENTRDHVRLLAYLANNFCSHSFLPNLRKVRTKNQFAELMFNLSSSN